MDPGGFHGWFQLVGDGIKFIQKEDIMPGEADRRVFALAPVVVVVSTFLVFVVIPAGPDLVVKNLDVGVFYALAVSSLSVIGVLMAGWASANKFALLGALRAAAQLIAYELPLLLAVVGVVIQAGPMSLQGLLYAQADGQYFGPAAIVNAHRFIFDSRDDNSQVRLDILNDKEGVWRCRTTFNCTDACPRGIQVTQAIAEVKQAIMRGKV